VKICGFPDISVAELRPHLAGGLVEPQLMSCLVLCGTAFGRAAGWNVTTLAYGRGQEGVTRHRVGHLVISFGSTKPTARWGRSSAPETSRNFLILTRPSARQHFIDVSLIVFLCELN